MNYSSSQIPKRTYKLVNELEFTKKEIKLMGYEKVIHCKDCTYHEIHKDNYICLAPLNKRGKGWVYTDPDFYCGWAERKDDVNERNKY